MKVLAMILTVAFVATTAAHAAPNLRVVRSDRPAHPNEPYRIACVVTWSGNPGQYAILPAKVESVIDWGTVKVEKTESTVRDGINTVTETVVITPAKTGDFRVPEILIAYRNPEDLTPPEASAPATNPTGPGVDPTLRADPFILHVKPDRTLAWVSGGLGALLLCLVLGWWFARHTRRPPAGHSSSPPTSASSAPEAFLEAAKQCRLDGHPYEFYLALNRALESCPVTGELSSTLRRRAQAVGYQGVQPSEEQMNTDYTEVQRAVERN